MKPTTRNVCSEPISMTTKNTSKSFKGKINGQRLPPIPITNEPSSSSTTVPVTTDAVDQPTSILKKSKPLTESILNHDHQLAIDEDDFETSRPIFRKSPADVLLLLDTYPPKTWTIPKCLQSNYDQASNQNRTKNSIFDTVISTDDQHNELIDAFPSPISDRLPSSRYCRRSVSSACSRRSSILFQRQTDIPLDSTQLQRENTFDTVCESLSGANRPTYTPLPPIPSDVSTNLTKSVTNPTTEEPPISLTKSLTIPVAAPLPSISPPLVTSEEIPTIQEKKEEFTRRLLSKSLRRDNTVVVEDKEMLSPTVIQKSTTIKPTVAPRFQKPIVDHRRVASIERPNPSLATNRSKQSVIPPPTTMATTTTTASIPVTASQARVGKFSLDIFQPQSKLNNSTNRKPSTITNKSKVLTKINSNATKVKVNPIIHDEETTHAKNDVIASPPSTSIETSQIIDSGKVEETPSPLTEDAQPVSQDIQPSILDSPTEPKTDASSRCSSRYSHHSLYPVPKPLTLQGEKTVDPDYPQTAISRTAVSARMHCHRRGSLKGQPLITELFEDPVTETENPVLKPEPVPPPKPSAFKMKKQRPKFLKTTKPKKPVITITKPKPPQKLVDKPSTVTTAVELVSPAISTEISQEENPNDNPIIIGGTDWVMSVKAQAVSMEESILSQLSDVPTIDDEDIPSCASPTDDLDVSQAIVLTKVDETERRNSIESCQAVEISTVLAQTIEHPVETTSQPSMLSPPPPQTTKSNESSLINSDIRAVYEIVQDSIRKNTSLRSLSSQSNEPASSVNKPSLPLSTASMSSNGKTLPFETTTSLSHTYDNSDTELSCRPSFRVVNDTLNSRGSETIDSTSSHEDHTTLPLCSESDCDEIYRTARKGRSVGRGAYGIVWSYLTMTGKVIAVKEIELDEGDSDRVRNDYESVREEVCILRELNHPYVVKFLGISLENTRLIKIFMEFLPNGTIENLLTSFGPFHNDILKKYTRQIVEGVSYLHENGVVHRDIKGKNVMLDVDGNIKLIDFGCAKRLKKNQNTHSMRQILKSMKGTANWMAPEVIAETGHGKKADIWSIGCTLCEMATGKPPWSSEHNHLAVLLIIANGTKPPADLPDTCPKSAQEFFRLCLTRDPEARPSAKDLLAHAFLAP